MREVEGPLVGEVEEAAGLAVRVVTVPFVYASTQSEPQLMPGPVATPDPVPARLTVNVNVVAPGGGGVGGLVTMMAREQLAVWAPLRTTTVEL